MNIIEKIKTKFNRIRMLNHKANDLRLQNLSEDERNEMIRFYDRVIKISSITVVGCMFVLVLIIIG